MAKKKAAHKIQVIKKPTPQEKPHKRFWLALGLLMILSVVVILNSISEPTLTGRATIQTLSFVRAGSSIEMEVKTPGMKALIVQVNKDIKNEKILVSEDKTIPFDGISLSKFIVSSTDASKLGRTQLILKIKQDALRNAGLSESEVALYVNKIMVPTIKTNPPDLLDNSARYIYYSASLNTFTEGHYVIGKQKYGIIAPVQQQPTATPLFEQLRNFFQQRVR